MLQIQKNISLLGLSGLSIASFGLLDCYRPAQAELLKEQMPGQCKTEASGHYNTNMADVAITSISSKTVSYKIRSTGKTGRCTFNNDNELVKIVPDQQQEKRYKATGNIYWSKKAGKWIASDGMVCHTCTPENGFPIPPKTKSGGFFYLPNEKMWYDSNGEACHTCNPPNGFPIPAGN